jgi:hypothetical protein
MAARATTTATTATANSCNLTHGPGRVPRVNSSRCRARSADDSRARSSERSVAPTPVSALLRGRFQSVFLEIPGLVLTFGVCSPRPTILTEQAPRSN